MNLKRNGTKPATKIDMATLKKDVKQHPDLYQYERAKYFGVTQGAIWFALQRLESAIKKLCFIQRLTSYEEYSFRQEYDGMKKLKRVLSFILMRVVFPWIPTDTWILHMGTRCYGQKDWHARGRLNAIGAVLAFKLLQFNYGIATLILMFSLNG